MLNQKVSIEIWRCLTNLKKMLTKNLF